MLNIMKLQFEPGWATSEKSPYDPNTYSSLRHIAAMRQGIQFLPRHQLQAAAILAPDTSAGEPVALLPDAWIGFTRTLPGPPSGAPI